MNYIKLQLGGKERGLKLGLPLIEKIHKTEFLSVQEIFTKAGTDTLLFVPKMIYYSLLVNCEISNTKAGSNTKVDFTYYDVMDWIDEIGILSDEVKEFTSKFLDSVKTHLPKKEENEGNVKAPKGAKK